MNPDVLEHMAEAEVQDMQLKRRRNPSPHAPYLRTLRRIPAETLLHMGARLLDVTHGATCVAGWALRAELLRVGLPDRTADFRDSRYNEPAETFDDPRHVAIIGACNTLFGGKYEDWQALYSGVVDERAPAIETAFAIAVAEAADAA
jgi:hypothetical protein